MSRGPVLAVTLTSDASKFGRGFTQATSQLAKFSRDIGRAAAGFGRHTLRSLDTFGGQIVDKISGWFKRGVQIGMGSLAALGGYSLWGGLNRLLDTEDATAQLKRMGLGLDDIKTLLDGVDTAFSGTPFANPDGFNVASQLYASQVELGKIPGIIATIGDYAAHGNVPLEQMAAIFTRVASQGKVTGDGACQPF